MLDWLGPTVLVLAAAANPQQIEAAGPERVMPPGPAYTVAKFETLEMRFDTLANAGMRGTLTETTPSPRNPHLDWRLRLTLTSPTNAVHTRPGFYAGDGRGGPAGAVWLGRFVFDEVGTWTVDASFRYGVGINIDEAAVGTTAARPDMSSFRVLVSAVPRGAAHFREHGPLRVDDFHLRHADGTQWVKRGTGSPENLLAYRGFHRTRDYGGVGAISYHGYAPHAGDWRPGDPNWSATVFTTPDGVATVVDPDAGRNIIGAFNFLATAGVNSIYFLPLNLGGDGQDTTPFVAETGTPTALEQTQYSVTRMHQWSIALEHAIDEGIGLEVVLAERESANVNLLGAATSVQRRLFLVQLVAMFGHHPAVRWVLCEENDPEPNLQFSVAELQSMAEAILDYANPRRTQRIAVSCDRIQYWDLRPLDLLAQIYQSPAYTGWLNSISLQVESPYSGSDVYGDILEYIRAHLEDPLAWNAMAVIHLDESGPPTVGINYGRNFMRKWLTWDVYLSRGYLALYAGTLDLTLDDFRHRDYEWIYRDAAVAAEVLRGIDLSLLEDIDGLLANGYTSPRHGPAELARIPDVVYLAFFSEMGGIAIQVGDLDMSSETGLWSGQWYDPRDMSPRGGAFAVTPGPAVALDATVPAGTGTRADLVLVIEKQ